MSDRGSEDSATIVFPPPFTGSARNAALPLSPTTPAPPAELIKAEL